MGSDQTAVGAAFPLRLKVGADVRREARDRVNPTVSYTFVGPDGIANTADDSVSRYDLVSQSWSNVGLPFGLGNIQRPAADKANDLLLSHPEYWTTNQATTIQSLANNSQKISELVAAYFIRSDISLLQNRLKLVGGVRYESTSDDGWGVLNDVSKTYQRDASGNIVHTANGTPVKITSDPVALARLQYTVRGSHVKRNYGDAYPSLNASYLITEKLMLRSSFARTITRPDFSNIIPSITASDPTSGTTPTITVNNTGLRPWYSNSYDVALEYYFDQPGVISVGAFRKDISDFFGSVQGQVTPEQLAEWGFDQSYANYNVVTKENIGSARVSGMEYEYRQTLPWVPERFGHVSLFFNSTALHVEGAAADSLSGFLPLEMNYGLTYSSSRVTVRLNFNQRGRTRGSQITGTSVEVPTFNYNSPKRNVDFNAEYRLTRRVSLFANIRNVTNFPVQAEAYGPSTPAYARGTSWTVYGPNALIGVKGSL